MHELARQLAQLPAHIRDGANPPPPGIETRRMAVYRELFFNNLESLLAGNFPVLKRILGEQAWTSLIADFLREHRASTPLFPEIAREMLRYLESRDDPEWWLELAHYEWVELALDIAEAHHEQSNLDDTELPSHVHLSPLAWPLAYRWPVHRLSPDFLPDAAPDTPTLLLVRRDIAHRVRFSELTPLSFRLLQRIAEHEHESIDTQLSALAVEAGIDEADAFLDEGRRMIREFLHDRVLVPV